MINDILIKLVADRFKDLKDVHIYIDRFSKYISVYVDTKDHTSVCNIYFKLDHIELYIYSCKMRYCVSYSDFTDIDEFVGDILCKSFYYDR